MALFEGDDVVLAELAEPCLDALMDLVLDAPVDAAASERDAFLEAVAPLARSLRVESSDGSLEVPAPPRPRLAVTVSWQSSTVPSCEWHWVYGDRRAPLEGADPLGGRRDPDGRALHPRRRARRAHLGHRLRDGDALALALHDLPHLRTLPDVEVEEHAPPSSASRRVSPRSPSS